MRWKQLAGYLLMSLVLCLVNCDIIVEGCKQKGCMALVISKALPIEFWVNGELTYNNTTYPNIQKFLYNQQFLCSDNIKLKVAEDLEGSPKEYRIDVYDENGATLLETIPFIRSSVSFFASTSFVGTNYGTGSSWNSSTKYIRLTNTDLLSRYLTFPVLNGLKDQQIDFNIPFNLTYSAGVHATMIPTYTLWNSDKSESLTVVGTPTTTPGNQTQSISFTPGFIPAILGIKFEYIFVGSGALSDITILSGLSVTNVYYTSSDYELNFVANDYDLCSKCLVFKIVQVETDTLLYSDDMTNFPASGWTQNSLTALFATSDWANAGAAQGTMGYHSPTTNNMKVLHHSQTIESGKKYRVDIRFLIEDNAISSNVYKLVLYNIGGGAILEQFEMSSVDGPTSGFDRTDSYIFTAGFDGDEIGVSTQLQASVDNDNNISINSFDIYEHVDEELIASSEAVEFSNDIEENVQMFYKSTEDFAGIKYSDLSDYFMVRFAGTFFHPNTILETSVIETTETIITNATALKKERRLQIDDIPEYRQDQLALVLMHSAKGSLKIHNVEWAASAAIEDDGERPGSYPMKAKTTMLTRKRFLYRNAI